MIDSIREFWRWWTTCPHPDPASINRHVHAISPGLSWELTSPTCLTVHANGEPTLRALAANWAAAAPSSSPGQAWTFLPTRPPSPTPLSGAVTVDGTFVDLSELRFVAEPSSYRPELDVTGVHPSFATLPAPTARRLTEVALDDVLGETLRDLWIGQITTASGVDPAGRVLAGRALLGFVGEFGAQERWRGWTRLGDSWARWPLRAARWPRFDTHLTIAVPPGALSSWPGSPGIRPSGAASALFTSDAGPCRASMGSSGLSAASSRSGAAWSSLSETSSGPGLESAALNPASSKPQVKPAALSAAVFGPALELAALNVTLPEPGVELEAARSPAPSEPGLRSACPSAALRGPELESAGPNTPLPGPGLESAALTAALPEPELELPAVRALARALGAIGADGVIVAWEGGGRIAHVYVDGTTDAAALVEASAGSGAVIERGYDPTLAEVQHLADLRASVRA